MPSIDRHLSCGEHVCYRARPHWIALVGPFAIVTAFGAPGVLLLIFSLVFWMDNFAVGSTFITGLVLVVGAGSIARALLHRAAGIEVTDRRILVTTGVLLKHRVAQWLVRELEATEIQQCELRCMLDYGSIVVHVAGKAAGPFRYVSQPWELRRRVEEEVKKSTKVSQRPAA